MKKIIALGILTTLTATANAGVARAFGSSAKAVYNFSPKKAAQVASYPVRHPKKSAHGVKKATL